MYKIVQKGNKNTNFSSRDGHIPAIIVNHISGGSMSSMDSWFQSDGNTVSSAHFGVSKAGEIHQYVAIDKMAWANGLKVDAMDEAKSSIVRERKPVNPNKYSVSIEHEGTDGTLTEAQFKASVWLHFYIQSEVERMYGKKIVFDEKHILGHFQIDPKRKPYCPGPNFPWARLYQELKGNTQAKEEDEPMTAAEKKEMDALKSTVEAQSKWIEAEKAKANMECPSWAKTAYEYYKSYIADSTGSYDFWRQLVINYRKENGIKVQTK